MNCHCKDWKENIEKVSAPLLLQSARSGFRVQYSGVRFRFCPWCSKPLVEPGSAVHAGQEPVDTAAQIKTESSGLSVGELCAEKLESAGLLPDFDFYTKEEFAKKDLAQRAEVAAIINQTIEEYGNV